MENETDPRPVRREPPPSHPDCPRCNLWAAFAEAVRRRDETWEAKRREILGDDY